jgi:hypothetical protein
VSEHEHMKEARSVRSQFNRYLYTSGAQEEEIDGIIAAALSQASSRGEQRGYAKGVEDAARVADREANTFNESLTRAERDAEYLKARTVAIEIRALTPSAHRPPDEAVEKLVKAANNFSDPQPFSHDEGMGCACRWVPGEKRWAYCMAHKELLEALAAVRATGGRV